MTGSERRLNLLTGEWVLISPERMARPWHGAVGAPAPSTAVHRDPQCNLCPGGLRMTGAHNPDYQGVYVFDNDFPALSSGALQPQADDPILVREAESGVCRVICYTPDHAGRMATMSEPEIEAVIEVWTSQFAELDARADIGAVTIFENHGEMVGASNPHPHGQIWATRSVPNELAKEEKRQRAWFEAKGTPLLADYLAHERKLAARIVFANDAFAVLVPFWAVWPFEVMLVPLRAAKDLEALDLDEREGLAAAMRNLAEAYDKLFGCEFPYSMGIAQAPTDGRRHREWRLHLSFLPPLLRSASVRKYFVGYELTAEPQRDFTPEAAVERLRAVSDVAKA